MKELGYHKLFESDPAAQYLHNCDSIEMDMIANDLKLSKCKFKSQNIITDHSGLEFE